MMKECGADNGSAGQDKGNDDGHVNSSLNVSKDCTTAIQQFLRPLKLRIIEEKLKQEGKALGDDEEDEGENGVVQLEVPATLFASLCEFICEPDVIYTEKGLLQRIYNQLSYTFNIKEGQSDLDDFMEFKPSEAMANKASQVLIALLLPDPKLFLKELENFKELIEDVRIARDGRAEVAYLFLYNMFNTLYEILSDQIPEGKVVQVVDFPELYIPSRCVVHALSVMFCKLFKIRTQERIARMKRVIADDPSSFEWYLTLAETYRLKRRDAACRNKWPTQEEMDLLEKAITIAPENPFVRLAVLDTIIGNVRDSSGRFRCGEIHLDNMEDSMRYLHENCQKLTTEFPNNATFLSIISDYFARYFPHQYFDIEISHKLLMSAYKLNPSHPKTTHRLGILWRMSYENIDESLKWLAKTVELDPTHYQGRFEYCKTLLGKFDKYDVAEMMETTLKSDASAGWSDFERSEFLFYLGLAHLIKDEKEMALEYWKEAAKMNENPFLLTDVLTSSENFKWDLKLISTDNIRLWVQEEKNILLAKEKAGEEFDSEKKKFLDRIFAIMLGRRAPFRVRNRAGFKSRFPNMHREQFVRLH